MTIKDIAKLCGVSVSTVSRVLNEHPDVKEDIRQQVLAVIKEYNYIPSNSARSLVKTTSDCIGLVVRGLSNPFYTDIIRSMEQRITARGYTMVMQQIGVCDDEVQCGAMMERDKRLQGILFLGGRSDYTPKDMAPINVPYVSCSYSNQYGSLPKDGYSSVSIDDVHESYRAVMELYNAGHRQIAALISRPNDESISQLRYEGYRKALSDCGIAFDENLVICANSFDIGNAYEATAEALKAGKQFTAIFSIADNMAIGAMRALREAGLSVPEDCSIVAIDGLEVSSYINPPLSTFCQPMEQMGRRSVDILLDVIQGKAGHRQELLETTFRPGQSIRRL